MPTKKLTPKKAANRQSDLLIMSILGLVVIGAAVIIWQSYQLNVLESTYSAEISSDGTSRYARLASSKSMLASENEGLKKRLERWNTNAVGSSLHGDVLKDALLNSGFNQEDPLLWEFYVLRVNKVMDDPKDPYSIMIIGDGMQDRGFLVAKRVGQDDYKFQPGTLFIVPNYAHQVVQNVKWAASKQVGYEILTKVEGESPDIIDKKTLDIKD